MRKVVPMAVAGGVLIASGGVFGATQAFAKDIQVSQDGVPVTIRTWSNNVDDVLKAQKINLGEHDIVAPARNTRIADGQQVSVRYGRALNLTVDGRQESMWTTSTTVEQVLAEMSVRDESKISVPREASIPRTGMELNIDTAKEVELVTGGDSKPVVSTAKTVADVLNEAQVQLTPGDTVVPAPETEVSEGMTVTVNKVDLKETSKKVDIPFKTVRKDSDSLPKGTEKVDTTGVNGQKIEVWTERFENGRSVSNTKTSERVEKEPVDQVVLVGTGDKSTPTPTPSPSASSSSKSSSSSSSSSAASNVSAAVGETCQASNYDEGQMTASGEQFNPNDMTAAHKTLPLGTRIKVTNPKTGKTVIVRINDRGPYVGGRCLDLSRAAFGAIGDLGAGVMTVTWQRV